MQKILIGLLVWIMSAMALVSQASAISITAQVPVVFQFSGDLEGSASASGFIVTLGELIGIFGIGVERVSVAVDDSSQDIKTTAEFAFTDVTVDFVLFDFNLALGYGMGTASLEDFTSGGVEFSSEEGAASQFFFRFGYPFNESIDISLSYHGIDAETQLSANGAELGSTTDVGGVMYAAGVTAHF